MKLLQPHQYFGLTDEDYPPFSHHELIGSRVLVREFDDTLVKGTIEAYYVSFRDDLELFGITRDSEIPGADGNPYSATDFYEPDWSWYERDEFIVLNYAGIDLLAAYIQKFQEAV